MKIYLDLDGVLTDFNGTLHKVLGLEFDYNNWPYTPGLWMYFNEMPHPIKFNDINDCCHEGFWADMPWLHDGQEILKLLESRYDSRNIYLLTCPMMNSGSWSGKYRWVRKNMPGYESRLIVTRAPKSLFAAESRGGSALLIDDKDKGVEEFREAGGHAVLVPRPWNSGYCRSDEVVESIKNDLNYRRL